MLAADDGDPQAQRLERMKGEFLVAQQRHRERAHEAVTRPDSTDEGPLLAGPAAKSLAATAAVTL
jgi:hypothetical protein